MYSYTDIISWFWLVGIFASFFIAFYIPGRVVIGNYKLQETKALHVVAIIIGIALWAWQGYIFGILHFRWLSYLYLLIALIVFITKKYYQTINISLKAFKKIDLVILIIGILGICAQMLPYVQMGLKTSQGVMVININRDDHIWHAGLVSEIADRFPPNEPGMAGVVLKDYHYWFNLTTAEIIRVFHVPQFQMQFIGMYSLACILLLFMGYYFAKLIYDNKLFIRLFLFFLFFSGDAAFWILLLFQHTISGSLSSLVNNATKFVDSPAFSYSMIIGLTGFYLLFQAKEKLPKRLIIVLALLFGSLLEYKIYTGITFMVGLGVLGTYSFFKKRFDKTAVLVLAVVFGAFIFFPNTSSSGGLFFLPFEIARDFVTQKALGLHDWDLRWWIYQDHKNYLRITQYGFYMIGVYLAVQFGIQLVGLIPWKKLLKILSVERALTFYSIILSGMIFGFFFYQKVGGANIWEFLLPVIVMLSLLTSLTVSLLLEKKNSILSIFIIIAIVVIVIPRWLLTVNQIYAMEYRSGFHGISNAEYDTYEYMRTHIPKDAVVMFPDDRHFIAYVSVIKIFSNSQLYLSGEGVRQQLTPEIIKRRAVVKTIANDSKNWHALLQKEHIAYLYYFESVPKDILVSNYSHVVFKNSVGTIIRVDL